MTEDCRSLGFIYSLATILSLISGEVFILSFKRVFRFMINRRKASVSERPSPEEPDKMHRPWSERADTPKADVQEVKYPSRYIRGVRVSTKCIRHKAAKLDWVSVTCHTKK